MSAAAPPPVSAEIPAPGDCGGVGASEACSAARAHPVILCVDDEPDMLTMLELCLSAEGFEVMTAQNAAKALQLVVKHPPDLIITDYVMPGTTGLALCRTLRDRAETRGIPIIVYSARDLREDYPGLFDRFLLKPAGPEGLIRLVRSLLATSHHR
jgi:two-component system, OmpR family, phosphate regulon response regulator PhoB